MMLEANKKLNMTYDEDADAAYIYIQEDSEAAGDTYECPLPDNIKSSINIDFDKEGRILGIEILDASLVLVSGNPLNGKVSS